jgi:hypothetical protein
MVQPENMEEGAFMRELPIRTILGNYPLASSGNAG